MEMDWQRMTPMVTTCKQGRRGEQHETQCGILILGRIVLNLLLLVLVKDGRDEEEDRVAEEPQEAPLQTRQRTHDHGSELSD